MRRLLDACIDSITQVLQLLSDGLGKSKKILVGERTRDDPFKSPGAFDVRWDRRVMNDRFRQAAEA
jgi:hypothetical protein